MARKSTIEKLKTRISNLEKDRQRKVDEQIELILKTDPEILQINSQIDDLRKMVKALKLLMQFLFLIGNLENFLILFFLHIFLCKT